MGAEGGGREDRQSTRERGEGLKRWRRRVWRWLRKKGKRKTGDERAQRKEREREREKLREREAFSRPPPRAVVRFGPRGRGEYERPNYENDPV